jgi:hypothetical protein
MKKTILTGFLAIATMFANAQTISDARNMGIGQTVTIRGVVTNGTELGSIRYVQDATGALPIYGTGLNGLLRGDSVTATGPLLDFSGLLEISPVSTFTDHGPAPGGLPTPLIIPLSVVNESIEAQLVRVDNVTFVQTGNFATGNSTVQITDGSTTLDVRINGTTNIDGSAIPTGPVSIIALVGQFNANYQLVPRDLNDIFPYVAPAREINVKMGGLTVLNNGTFIVGNASNTTVLVENSGAQNLSISNTTLTGTNASDFSINLTTGVIGATSSQSYTLSFNPGGTGSRSAQLNIFSDDTDENPYVINLSAVGTDNLATEPTSNPTGFTFPLVKAYTIGGQFTAGTNAEKYIVLWKKGAAITGVPIDGNTYKRGDMVGDAKVAYVGSGTSFTPRHVIASTNYYFAVYAFNGSDGFENYKTTSPATGTVTSQGSQTGNYYAGINSTNTNFLTSLSSLINPHNFVSYFNYKTTMMNQFEIRDTTAGQSYVLCVYSGERKVFNDPFDWTAVGYSREHSYCHSWMPTFPCDNPEQKEYNDQHNLYPTNLQNANTPRSNLPMGIITGDTVFNYLGCAVGFGSNGQYCFTPRPEQRGNAARAIFYMATCYNGQLGNNWQLPSTQNQEILKEWHYADLPDNYEIARHEYVYSLQNNRNPFIDSVDFVCNINFSNMSYQACQSQGSLNEQLKSNFSVFPVPSNNKVYAQVNGLKITSYSIVDLQGRLIDMKIKTDLSVLELNATEFKSGIYILKVGTEFGEVQRQFIIE